jgi:hypothetical protein
MRAGLLRHESCRVAACCVRIADGRGVASCGRFARMAAPRKGGSGRVRSPRRVAWCGVGWETTRIYHRAEWTASCADRRIGRATCAVLWRVGARTSAASRGGARRGLPGRWGVARGAEPEADVAQCHCGSSCGLSRTAGGEVRCGPPTIRGDATGSRGSVLVLVRRNPLRYGSWPVGGIGGPGCLDSQ